VSVAWWDAELRHKYFTFMKNGAVVGFADWKPQMNSRDGNKPQKALTTRATGERV
jgi:hypothetical protein